MITTPQVNNNGTSKQELLEGALKVRRLIGEASRAIQENFPHGRDYQTLPATHYIAARKDWEEHLKALIAIEHDFLELAIAISDQ